MATTTPVRLHYYNGLERVRYVGSWLVTVVATIVFGTVGILVSFFDRSGDVTHACARLWGRAFLWICGISLRVEGVENLELGRPYVFVANHHSALDIPALMVALPVRFRMLAKASLFRIPFVGWYMKRVGYVPVERTGRGVGLRTIESAALRAGERSSILVFAEGTRTPEGSIGRFKKGGFYIARQSGLDVVPIALINSGCLLPRGERWPDPGTIDVRIGAPLRDDPDATPTQLAERIRASVLELRAKRG